MNIWLLNNETVVRFSIFFGLFILLACLELAIPRLQPSNNQLGIKRFRRWFNNFCLISFSSMLLKLIIPMGLMAYALHCQQSGWGLFNQTFIIKLDLPYMLIFMLSLLLFDLIIYWQHRLFHRVPILWRLHKVHHSDVALDASSAIRFHPIEIVLSSLLKVLAISLFGFSAISVLIFEVLLNALALFNHSNIKLTLKLDTIIRKFIVTPDMHRIHHSKIVSEHNHNFGFNISLWDKLFNSYQEQPQLGQEKIEIGLSEFNNEERPNRLGQLLIMPFK